MVSNKSRIPAENRGWQRVQERDKEKISLKQALNLKFCRIGLLLIRKGLEKIEIVYLSHANRPRFYTLTGNRQTRLVFLQKVASLLVPSDAKPLPDDELTILLAFGNNANKPQLNRKIKSAPSGVADDNWPRFIEDMKSYRPLYGPWVADQSDPDEGKRKYTEIMKNYLSARSEEEIRQKVREFRFLNFSKLSYGDVRSAVDKVMSVIDQDGNKLHSLQVKSVTFEKGSRFYRVVRHEIKSSSDLWCPPEDLVEMGRLNLRGEQVLYTSPNLTVALDELKIGDGETTTIISYSSKCPTTLVRIGLSVDDGGLASQEMSMMRELNDFLLYEFMRDVGRGTEYLYQISNVIAEYFVYPESVGYYYPSMKDKSKWNVCFSGNAVEEYLKINSIGMYKCWRDRDSEDLVVKCEGRGYLQSDGSVVWSEKS